MENEIISFSNRYKYVTEYSSKQLLQTHKYTEAETYTMDKATKRAETILLVVAPPVGLVYSLRSDMYDSRSGSVKIYRTTKTIYKVDNLNGKRTISNKYYEYEIVVSSSRTNATYTHTMKVK